VLEEELKKQRKRMDEYVLEEKKRLEEERGRREAEARDREAAAALAAERAAAAAAAPPPAPPPAAASPPRARAPAASPPASPPAPSPTPERRRSVADDLAKSVAAEIRSRLAEGIAAVKHGRKGAPKKRRIFLDVRTNELYWDNSGKPDKRFALTADVVVKRGKATPVFQRSSSASAAPSTCFSLVVGEGWEDPSGRSRDSLDLQCDSKQARDALATGLETLVSRLKAAADM